MTYYFDDTCQKTILSFYIQLTSQLFVTCSYLWDCDYEVEVIQALPNLNFDNYQILNFGV